MLSYALGTYSGTDLLVSLCLNIKMELITIIN